MRLVPEGSSLLAGTEDPRKSPAKGSVCVLIPGPSTSKILEFWPEVCFYPYRIGKTFDVCARTRQVQVSYGFVSGTTLSKYLFPQLHQRV